MRGLVMPNRNDRYLVNEIQDGTIPIIDINDKIVDEFGKPTMVLSMFFTVIVKYLESVIKNKVEEAPMDGNTYARKDGQWVQI